MKPFIFWKREQFDDVQSWENNNNKKWKTLHTRKKIIQNWLPERDWGKSALKTTGKPPHGGGGTEVKTKGTKIWNQYMMEKLLFT